MVDSLEKLWLKVLENKFLLVGIFWASKREKDDHLDACMSVHRAAEQFSSEDCSARGVQGMLLLGPLLA